MQKILIVDDEPINIKVLVDLLSPNDKVIVAKDGEQALRAAAVDPKPDLILMDVVMPIMDGFDACQRLKSDPETQDIPIIFITSMGDVESETRGLELGAVDYIQKPFHRPIVLARVNTHLGLRRKTLIIERIASLDGLTEIPNRRAFDIRLDEEWRRAVRGGTPISLLMIDVDMFKQFNDNYGHGAGDACLKRIAATLADSVSRPGDFIARYGGEEFAAILGNTNRQGALTLAENFREMIEGLAIVHEHSSAGPHVTISLGAATDFPLPNDSLDDFKRKADEMLYAAKNAGRNTVKAIDD